jgi:type 1 glutamine amidotransferase
MAKGVGLVCLHYTVIVPKEKGGDEFLKWIGGYFDFQTGPGANHWFSKIELKDYQLYPATPAHPVCRGLEPFSIHEELYYNLRFPEDKKNLTPLITFDPEKKDWSKVVGWCIERPNGGRGVGYTGGHFFSNFQKPEVQRFLLNAILWSAHAENASLLPEAGEDSKAGTGR